MSQGASQNRKTSLLKLHSPQFHCKDSVFRIRYYSCSVAAVGVGDGAGKSAPPQKKGKYFSSNYDAKFGHFSGKYRVKFGNFVILVGKYHVKFGHFVNFSYTIFGQKCLACLAIKVDWAPTPMVAASLRFHAANGTLSKLTSHTDYSERASERKNRDFAQHQRISQL